MGHTLAYLTAVWLAAAGVPDGGTADGGSPDTGAADAGSETAPDAGLGGADRRRTAAVPDGGLDSDDERALYALGFSLGGGVAGFDLTGRELEIVIRGLIDSVNARAPAVPVQEYATRLRDLHQQRLAERAQKERQRSKAFLVKAAADRRAVKLQSGLIYKDVRRGRGPSPGTSDTVRVHYRGTLIDGSEFDSSYTRGDPAEFAVEGVIPCWKEALQRMKVGGAARIVCPSALAYGDRGVPPDIPGGAALIFDVELLEVVPRPPGPPPDAGGP